jgi:hypothetical protein
MQEEPPVYESGIDATPVEPEITKIYLSDILNDVDVVKEKERVDRSSLQSILALSTETLRSALIRWAQLECPNAHPIYRVTVIPPASCSDGVTRNLDGYVTYLTGSPMSDFLEPLRVRLPDITVSFATTGPEILIVVSKV